MRSAEEMMEILEAFDLVGTYRGAAALVGCDHKTVARLVELRARAGGGALVVVPRARPAVDPFAGKIAEWVDRSKGSIHADVAHQRLLAMGYLGSERTTRRAVAAAKRSWRAEHGRRTRPWIPEPGLWLQFDYGDGPVIGGRRTSLLCAWLAWSRYRVVVPLVDRTLGSVVLGLDRVLREVGGVPTYVLTDNERTVTVDHVCGIAVRNPKIVAAARHYGFTVQTCVPADPQSKGGSEATVRIAKADLVPTDHNLRDEYTSFAELEEACRAFGERVNAREHRVTRRPPAVMLGQERARLHSLPERPHTLCFGETRKVSWQSTISVGGAIYSVPSALVDQRVWARADGDELVVVHADGPGGPREVARHQLTTPGQPRICDEHYPPKPPGALERVPTAQTEAERAFLAVGPGASEWLTRAAAAGTVRLRRKMAEAVDLAKLHGASAVDHALAAAADAGRFEEGAVASILAHQQHALPAAQVIEFPAARTPEAASLQHSTRSWRGFGT
ncbi:MAG TPA: IS21 family transposase [Solirubrobacter sp.]|nr:IS21 family transposase [Solirubrobacter sp.]